MNTLQVIVFILAFVVGVTVIRAIRLAWTLDSLKTKLKGELMPPKPECPPHAWIHDQAGIVCKNCQLRPSTKN